MEFFFAVFFLLFYYLRPQDWVAGMGGVTLIKPIIALWVFALVAIRSRPSPLPGVFRTPHDWIMVSYLAYIVFFGGASVMAVLPMLAFYMLTVQSLNTWDRLLKYLTYWNGALVAICAIAVLSTVGLDLTGAQDNIFTQNGRLAINTWLHNNPNSLAHSIIVVIPTSFLLYFWKGNLLKRFLLFPAMAALAFYCAWLTQSKGAYLVGAAMIVLALILGRPKWFQAILLVAAMVGGVSALSFLPRMADMNNLGADEGVQGRLLAWEMARTAENSHRTGVGWKQFSAEFLYVEGWYTEWVKKATHSSYVQVGADLGRYGLFFYLAGIWCSLHTLLVLKSSDPLQERSRRVLMVFLLANIMSGWMINRQYHTEYFLLIAAAAAMHRLRKADEYQELKQQAPENEEEGTKPKIRELWENKTQPAFTTTQSALHQRLKPIWNRFGILDLTCSIGLTWLTLWTWDYLLRNI